MKNDLKFLEDLNNKYNNQFDNAYLEKNPDRHCHFYVKCNIHGEVSNRKERLLSVCAVKPVLQVGDIRHGLRSV